MNRSLIKLQAFSSFPDLAYFNTSPHYNLSQKDTDRTMPIYAQYMTVTATVILGRCRLVGGDVEEKMLN